MKTYLKETYEMEVRCQNCGKVYSIKIEKGVRVENQECLICGCQTLVRDMKISNKYF